MCARAGAYPGPIANEDTRSGGRLQPLCAGRLGRAIGDGDSPEITQPTRSMRAPGWSMPKGRCCSPAKAPRSVRALIDAGVPFDRAHDGTITLGREAAHSFARIVHAGGDFTGRNLINALLRMVAATPSVRVISECFVVDMVKQDGRVSGLLAYQAYEGWVRVHANHVVLATGGIGNLWRETTNPAEGTGDGLARGTRGCASPISSSCSFIRRRCCRPSTATARACRC